MKTIFAVLISLFVLPVAFACPDLSGTYTCEHEGMISTFVVDQRVSGGITTYSFTDDGERSDVIADGQSHAMPDTGDMRNASYTAQCQGSEFLEGSISGIIDMEGQAYDSVIHMIFSRSSDGGLAREISGTVGEYEIPRQTDFCSLK